MRASEAESVPTAAYVAFRVALLDFSEEPTPANLVRYLQASRELDGLDREQPAARSPSWQKAQR
jgi:hypothetical protein